MLLGELPAWSRTSDGYDREDADKMDFIGSWNNEEQGDRGLVGRRAQHRRQVHPNRAREMQLLV